MAVIGADLGTSNIRAVLVDDDHHVVGHATLATPRGADRLAIVDVLEAAVRAAIDDAEASGADVDIVGVASPGAVMDGTVGGAANMPGWTERFALKEMISQRLSRPVHVCNDATAAAVAEHEQGAAVGVADVLYAHSGTGVGSGLILDGRAYRGGRGGAGEFGHMVVVRGGATCTCGRQGCVEAYAGRRAMEMAARRAVASGRSTNLFALADEMARGRVTSPVFQAALTADDELVHELAAEAIAALGTGIASVVNLLDVDLVVVGGGLGDELGAWYRHRMEAAMRPHLFLQPPHVSMVGATVGPDGGAIGATWLARRAEGDRGRASDDHDQRQRQRV